MSVRTDIRPARDEDARALAAVMRPEDVRELAASGHTPLSALEECLERSDVALALEIDGEVAAMWGAGPLHPKDRSIGVAWALTGRAVNRHRKLFLRLCRPAVELLHELFPVLINAVDARYEAALRWARWLGFEVEPARPMGAHGELFHPITLRRS